MTCFDLKSYLFLQTKIIGVLKQKEEQRRFKHRCSARTSGEASIISVRITEIDLDNFDIDLYPNFVQLLKERGAIQIEDWLSPKALEPHVNKVELVAAMEKIRTDETFARKIIYQALPPICRGISEAVIEKPNVPRFFGWWPFGKAMQSCVRTVYKDKASDDDIIHVKAKILEFLKRLVVLS